MKKILLLFLFLSNGYWVQAQLFPQHSQFFLNNYLLNPAVSGIEDYVDIKMDVRSQWNGIEGRPETQYLSFHMPLYSKIPNDFKVNPVKPSHMREESKERMETVSGLNHAHHGIGGVVMLDKTGNYKRYQALASYAYHMPLTKKMNVSLGVAAGINVSEIDLGKVQLADMTDPILTAENYRTVKPVIQLGGWIYHRNYYLGISYFQNLGNSTSFSEFSGPNNTIGGSSQAFLTAGYRLRLNRETTLIPMMLIKKTMENLPYQIDLAFKTSFYNRYWAGISLRELESTNIFLGFALNPLLEVSYSYDLGIGGVDQYSAGSHEIMIGLRLNNKNKVYCPNFH